MVRVIPDNFASALPGLLRASRAILISSSSAVALEALRALSWKLSLPALTTGSRTGLEWPSHEIREVLALCW